MHAFFDVKDLSEQGRKRLLADPKEPMLHAEWFQPIFMHHRIDPQQLQPYIPAEYELETFDGSAWVTLVAMTMKNFHPFPQGPWLKYLFPILQQQQFLNVRTYVKHHATMNGAGASCPRMGRDAPTPLKECSLVTSAVTDKDSHAAHHLVASAATGKDSHAGHHLVTSAATGIDRGEPGLFFFWGWLSRPFGLPLPEKPIGLTSGFASIQYTNDPNRGLLRGNVEGRHHAFRFQGKTDGNFELPKPGTFEEFALERYSGFFKHGKHAKIFRAFHPPWSLAAAQIQIEDNSLVALKLPWFRHAHFECAHYSPGFTDVWMGRPHNSPERPKFHHVAASTFFTMP